MFRHVIASVSIVAAIAVPQFADLLTADLSQEIHPIGRELLNDPITAWAVKLCLVILVTAIVVISLRKHNLIAYTVMIVAASAGILGVWSNGGF